MAENGKMQVFDLKNDNGLILSVSNYGAKILNFIVPDKNGVFDDIVLGFDSQDEYLLKEPYFGAVCGRFANRIKNAEFVLDGIKYALSANNGRNHLHGGIRGFESKYWDVKCIGDDFITLSLCSPDGEENYPGNLMVDVTYRLSHSNEVIIDFQAVTDKPTIINLCNHAYFNLNGAGNGTVYNHYLYVNADFYTVKDSTDALTGEIRNVNHTSLDFRLPVLIGNRIKQDEYIPSKGIDNNWAVRKNQPRELVLAGYIYEPGSGRKLEVLSTQPGLQIYTGNWIEKQTGKGGKTYDIHSAICMETQGFPNSPNIPFFPSSILRPGEKYEERCIYRFTLC